VIPTFNRADMLASCLHALDGQRLSRADYEVVVVDDGSTDRTRDVIREWTLRTGMSLCMCSRSNGGPAAARNDGIRRARGALIAFVDDDCLPEPDWLQNLVDALPADTSCAGIGGRIVGKSDALVAQYVDWRGLLDHQQNGGGIVYLVTANALFRKSCLLEVGGFDERFRWAGGEDPELARRLRARGYYLLATERALVVHRHRETFRGLMDAATRYGRGAAVDAQLRGQSVRAQRLMAFVMAANNISAEARKYLTRGGAAPINRVAYLGLGIAWQLAHARAYASCPPTGAPAPAGGLARAPGPYRRLIRRVSAARNLLGIRLSEQREHAPQAVRWISRWMKYATGRVLVRTGRRSAAFSILAKLHQADAFDRASRLAEQLAQQFAVNAARGGAPRTDLCRDYARTLRPPSWAESYFRDPCSLLGRLALVIKPRSDREKGVLVVKYNYTFSHIYRFFDIERIASKYHIVLEPSWSGYCNRAILQYCSVSAPVFVEAAEPRDAEFIRTLGANLVAVPIASNWWVDHRVFRPLPGVTKDTDVVMVATWARYKRHFQFFRVLGALRRQGHPLRVLLIGYAGDMTRNDIAHLAAFFGISDQIEIYDGVSQERVNELVNRARVSLIWSRREGVNRAIIESMFAGVPCILRDGFNYGYKYPYVNEQTGCFTSETDLPQTLLGTIRSSDRYSPREWVSVNMSCQRATALLDEAIGARVGALAEPWSGGLAVKTNSLQMMAYWNVEERDRFEADYAFLRTTLRG